MVVLDIYIAVMLREILYGVAGFVLFAYTLEWLFSLFDDPREPKRLQPKIPLLGHLLGMIKYSSGYHGITRYDNVLLLKESH